jgi:hypothetical protein
MGDFKLLFLLVAAFGLMAAGWWFGWFGPISSQFHSINSNVVARPSKPATYKNHGWPIPD